MERWNINRTVYKVSDFLSWQRNNSLELSPSFQRRAVWSTSAKSYLIDTIVKGLPIPIIFLREITDLSTFEPKRQVVDGQQRIRTILSYIDPKCLKDYRRERDFFQVRNIHNSALSGKNFQDLPDQLIQRILDYQFSVHVLPTDVDDKQVLQIFARMNSTGVKLNGQELRNASYFGDFKQCMYILAYEQLERWRRWGIFSEDEIARMAEVEMTSDLTLMMFEGIAAKSKNVLDKIYKKYEENFREKQIIKSRFQNVMDTLDNIYSEQHNFRQFRKKTLFYSLFALVYDLHYGLKSKLIKSKKKPININLTKKITELEKLFSIGKIPEKVALSVTTRTSTIASRKPIFEYIKGKCISV